MQVNIQGVLRKNRALANIHAGRRCFILGNGPSIKGQNVMAVKEDVKIALNWFHKAPECLALDPQYWLVADPDAWKEHESFIDPLMHFMLESPIRPKLFLPANGIGFVANAPCAGLLDIHFFQYDRSRQLSEGLDFCRAIPEFGQNVVIPAMMLALYLGCNPIYLLGCDHDWWAWKRENFEGQQLGHFYEAAPAHSVAAKHSYDDLQRTIRVQRYQYRQLKDYAEARGVSILNATRGGHLDIFPRADFDALWAAGNGSAGGSGLSEGSLDGPNGPAEGYARAVIDLLNRGDSASALVLAEKAIQENQDHSGRVEGLDYLKAVCLSRLGRYPEALVMAKSSLLREASIPADRKALIRDLEKRLSA